VRQIFADLVSYLPFQFIGIIKLEKIGTTVQSIVYEYNVGEVVSLANILLMKKKKLTKSGNKKFSAQSRAPRLGIKFTLTTALGISPL